MPENPYPSRTEQETTEGISWSRQEIDAAIAGLDRVTRNFSRQAAGLGDAGGAAGSFAAPRSGERAIRGGHRSDDLHLADRDSALDERMRVAEREAREYLERAKQRADSLVNTMIGSVEREAAEIRRDAEKGIRERWRAVEAEAGRYLDDAKRVADGMVAERQQRIGRLSDGLIERADSLTRGMDEAERVRRQFDDFVRALSEAASRIAREPGGGGSGEIASLGRPRGSSDRASALAA
jgi:hypothetical protein